MDDINEESGISLNMTPQLAELSEHAHDVEECTQGLESLLVTMEELDSLLGEAEGMEANLSALSQDGDGISESQAILAQEQFKHLTKRLKKFDPEVTNVIPAIEAFHDVRYRVKATQLSLEGLQDVIKQIIEFIVTHAKKFYTWLMSLATILKDSDEKVRNTVAEVKEQVKKVTGNPPAELVPADTNPFKYDFAGLGSDTVDVAAISRAFDNHVKITASSISLADVAKSLADLLKNEKRFVADEVKKEAIKLIIGTIIFFTHEPAPKIEGDLTVTSKLTLSGAVVPQIYIEMGQTNNTTTLRCIPEYKRLNVEAMNMRVESVAHLENILDEVSRLNSEDRGFLRHIDHQATSFRSISDSMERLLRRVNTGDKPITADVYRSVRNLTTTMISAIGEINSSLIKRNLRVQRRALQYVTFSLSLYK